MAASCPGGADFEDVELSSNPRAWFRERNSSLDNRGDLTLKRASSEILETEVF
jgi:hypothetical protein